MKLFKHLISAILVLTVATPVPAQDNSGYFTSFDSTKIYYESKGTGPAVLLVHGFIVNGESWKKTELYKRLLAGGYRVVTIDLRGNGKSGKPHTADAYANDAEARDIMGTMKMLGIRRYIAVGYSRGSIITARLMVRDPGLRAAVLGGMGTDFTNPDWPRRIMFYNALKGDSVPELATMVKYVKDSGLDQEALALLQKEQPSTPLERLKNIDMPVLAIAGKEDSDNGSARELASVFPKGEYAEVPGDHNHASQTGPFADAVLAFISKVK